ncbi:MAG: FtsQ-type POTRA domain-containing protein [Deltaproteobacteria bacterium]|nr:FtsQ-type POTRA domain-containing protein [Deltaproteobacteria bacterium]
MRKNRRRRSRFAWRRALRALAGAAALAGATVAAGRLLGWAKAHPYFAVREIDVAAHGRLDGETLLAWSGLAPGMSVWDVRERDAEARLLAHPRIREASVGRRLPGQVVIRVEEREPVALLFAAQPLWVAADGEVFPPCEGETTDGFPYVSGVGGAARSGAAAERLRRAARLVVSWREHARWPAISEVRPAADEITVFLVGTPMAVRFPLEAGAEDFARLGTVLEIWRGREAQLAVIDLSLPGEAVLRLRGAKRGAPRFPLPAAARPDGTPDPAWLDADRRSVGRGSAT